MQLPTIHGVGPAIYLELPAIIVGALSGGDFIDALSLGFFGIAGAERALSLGIPEPGALWRDWRAPKPWSRRPA